jgi:hypothetical protein
MTAMSVSIRYYMSRLVGFRRERQQYVRCFVSSQDVEKGNNMIASTNRTSTTEIDDVLSERTANWAGQQGRLDSQNDVEHDNGVR